MEDIKNAIPVSMLGGYLKKIIDAEELLFNIRVYGEITDFSMSKNIAYFSLKDEEALIQCVCFNANWFPLIKNGAQVVLTGSPKYWVKGGKISFQVAKVEDFGKGKAYLEFLALKEKLQKLGLFDESKKQKISRFAKNIGVVSSRTGAVIRDIVNIVTRRNPYVNIVLYPVQVQGAGASETIIEGVKFLDEYNLDTIIIARGGGSNEDLSAFNSEALAMAIFNAKTPVISAVGHETDFTICDFVSDLRAPTPSAAAELTTIDIYGLFDYLNSSAKKMYKHLLLKIENNYSKINLYKVKIENSVIKNFENKVNLLKNGSVLLKTEAEKLFVKNKNNLDIISGKFEKLSPLEVLKSGYAKVSIQNMPVNFNNIILGSNIDIDMFEGKLSASVIDKKERK